MKKIKKNRKLNNSGVALVMVIVVISFVSIVATILLYMAAINFYMKTTDIKTKESFYSGEEGMEQIKASFMVDASEAYQEAYREVIIKYAQDADTLQKDFSDAFLDSFEHIWLTHVSDGTVTQPDPANITGYFSGLIEAKDGCTYDLSFTPTGTGSVGGTEFSYTIDKTNGKAIISTLSYTFTDNKKYTTIISTDFVITAPKINFEVAADITESEYVRDLVACVNYENWTKR